MLATSTTALTSVHAHMPFGSRLQALSLQSLPLVQRFETAHLVTQVPPQSVSVSLPFLMPSKHEGCDMGPRAVGISCYLNHWWRDDCFRPHAISHISMSTHSQLCVQPYRLALSANAHAAQTVAIAKASSAS
jgi:hypothetical protein